ncbi:DNA topoisomerase IB [Methylibium sp.]|uniref:DNA topoisomerase IB n=1 Tax=Methylibium sp. TaxID=2067992 RepID=UPI0025ED2A6C|nr:DNA topoisomerase IB [Methylibium sp.]
MARASSEPEPESARVPVPVPAGLVYVSDTMPGHRRVRRGQGFAYRGPDGTLLRDRHEVDRIRRLAIPPAYEDVWICPLVNGHLQATARDARGRKQYRYHAVWNAQRGDDKFERMQAFGKALPRIRSRIARDLREAPRSALPRTLVLATLVRLLDTTFVRVGNDEYARSNGSFGLTTLRNRHVEVRGSLLRLTFKGKSGVQQQTSLDDPRIARIVRRLQQLPGQELFQYEDESGGTHGIDSADVNEYLAEITGERFTAKDFRTWHGSVQALELTRLACAAEAAAAGGAASAKDILAAVAKRLGNTPAVARKSYIHPQVLELGSLINGAADSRAALCVRLHDAARPRRGLQASECRLLGLLEERSNSRRRRKPALAAA